MNKLLRKNTGSASLIAMLLTGAMSIMMLTMLERIIPASRNTKGIENSASATYIALSGIEQTLNSMNINNPGHSKSGIPNESIRIKDVTGRDSGTGSIKETSGLVPLPGSGNSDLDKNWNKITPGKPVQIFLTKDFISNSADLNDLKLDFRVPKLGTGTQAGSTPTTTFSGTTLTGAIINLALTNATKNLIPNYKCSLPECGGIKAGSINLKDGVNLGGLQVELMENSKLTESGSLLSLIKTDKDHITGNGVLGCGDGCILKLFIVNKLTNRAGNEIPYLEYRIRKTNPGNELLNNCTLDYNSTNYMSCVSGFSFGTTGIPLQYAEISGIGKLGPFEQKLTRYIQQITTGDAFDFTVIQG